MQTGSKRRRLRYSGIVAGCRGAFTFLEIISFMKRLTLMAVNRARRALSTALAVRNQPIWVDMPDPQA
jgi:hypothetical protein